MHFSLGIQNLQNNHKIHQLVSKSASKRTNKQTNKWKCLHQHQSNEAYLFCWLSLLSCRRFKLNKLKPESRTCCLSRENSLRRTRRASLWSMTNAARAVIMAKGEGDEWYSARSANLNRKKFAAVQLED